QTSNAHGAGQNPALHGVPATERFCQLLRDGWQVWLGVSSEPKAGLLAGLGIVVLISALNREAQTAPSNLNLPMSTNTAAATHTNRLAQQKSPYLLQHQHN